MEAWKWIVVIKLQLLAVLVGEMVPIVSGMSVGDNSVGFAKQGFGLRRLPYKSFPLKQQQHQQQRRLKQSGNEIIPAVGTNEISEEPTCEELRAMWRYYKRQSRAELDSVSNSISVSPFGKTLNPFIHAIPKTAGLSSFGKGPKNRNKNRLRFTPTYGRTINKPDKSRQRERPFDVLRGRMRNPGGTSSSSSGGSSSSSSSSSAGESANSRPTGGDAGSAVGAMTSKPSSSATVHYSPPPNPPKESSFQKLREIISNERMRERGPAARVATSGSDNREFGKVILSPPRGQDGRRINKPLELMTPFEKIRFGHADDLLDEGIRPNLDVMKRRTLPLSVLRTQWKQPQQQQQQQSLQKRRFLSNPALFITSSSQSDSGTGGRATTFTGSSYFEKRGEQDENNNNNIIAQTNDKQQLDSLLENKNVSSQLHEDNLATLLANNGNNVVINNGGFTDSVIDEETSPFARLTSPPRQLVELPTCAEVEHGPCNQTLDCSCAGFALYRCYLNQCQILPLAYSVPDELPSDEEPSSSSSSWSGDNAPDIWHSEPIPSEKLGIWEEPVVDMRTTAAAAARLNTNRARETIQNEGKPNDSLNENMFLVLQGQNSYT